ncbi:putative RING-H2 finger protein ATL21A [Rosa sericea]
MEGYNLLMTIFTYEINTFDKPDQYVEDPSQPVLAVKFDYAEHHRYGIYSLQYDTPIHHSIKKEDPHVSRFTLAEFKNDEDDEWKERLYYVLDSFSVTEEDQDEIVDKIIEVFNREIGTLGSDNDPKILALSVDMKLTHFLVCQRELVARELRKRMLKRVRVVKDEEVEEDQYRESRKRRKIVGESDSCTICLEEFGAENDDVFCMPCSHVFHGKECIEKWLRENDNCPVCRFQLHVC